MHSFHVRRFLNAIERTDPTKKADSTPAINCDQKQVKTKEMDASSRGAELFSLLPSYPPEIYVLYTASCI